MHLAGLSHIAPCARTLILDGVSLAPRYDGNDPLCLDGMRMVPPAGFAATGRSSCRPPGAHAEVTAIQTARDLGTTLRSMAVTRSICPQCIAVIEASGGTVTSSTTAVWLE
ncbi:MAG: hypothetical protein IT374_25665 [Polyangiaceae bacterium]|nr:hypothetical protein [Polyangiaceae bacterium]